jgi:hypothetical protein
MQNLLFSLGAQLLTRLLKPSRDERLIDNSLERSDVVLLFVDCIQDERDNT